jgi:hypothetical protein
MVEAAALVALTNLLLPMGKTVSELTLSNVPVQQVLLNYSQLLVLSS